VVGESIIEGKSPMRRSENAHDWLGHGFYFWEGNRERALDWAKQQASQSGKAEKRITKPFVIGAIIDLGHCLNLLEQDALLLVKENHEALLTRTKLAGAQMPKNKPSGIDLDYVIRHLDCAVIEVLHENNKSSGGAPYDSVRAVFVEGTPLYQGAGFRARNHIQICVRTEQCIKGFFLPRT